MLDAPSTPTAPGTRARRGRGEADAAAQQTRRERPGPAREDEPPSPRAPLLPPAPPATAAAPAGAALSAPPDRVASAEWNLLTGEADCSEQFHRILGRDPSSPALTLDELPSVVPEEDRPRLTAMVTGCLVDARPGGGEFRVVRADGTVRTVHLAGEPVLGADGCAVALWAVLRDVGASHRTPSAVRRDRAGPLGAGSAQERLT
ncbi:PAS domain-containing protein [Streptomyces sp. NPDC046985]|uniref:PAS domain-containing protein n=1 Tax=Streptomyces sp. NPDC046985 TaxID=3155377 RepID=UPI0033C5CA58